MIRQFRKDRNFMGQAKKTITKHANDANAAPSAAQPQPDADTSVLLGQKQDEGFQLTSEIDVSLLSDDDLHNETVKVRDDANRLYKDFYAYARDRLMPFLQEIIKRYKQQGRAAPYRLNGMPTIDEYFRRVLKINYSTFRNWIQHEKAKQSRDGEPEMFTPAPETEQEQLSGEVQGLVTAAKTGGDVDAAAKKVQSLLPDPFKQPTKPTEPVGKVHVLTLRLVRELEALYDRPAIPMPKKLAVIIERIKATLGQPKPPVSATISSEERKEGTK
jgi:hypothetical protein